MDQVLDSDEISAALVALYSREFGGKESGRYRISGKLMRLIAGRRRLYQDDIVQIARALYERGYVLIDLDSFYVVLSANSFINYRRASESAADDVARLVSR